MIFLAIGSNLPSKFGDRFKNIELAMNYLQKNNISIVKKSSFYETLSYPDKIKPKFINVVISVKCNLEPEVLAGIIIDIEEKLDRKRSKKMTREHVISILLTIIVKFLTLIIKTLSLLFHINK